MVIKIDKNATDQTENSIEDLRGYFYFWSNIKACDALKNKNELIAASKSLETLNLPPHHDFQKNWDTLKSLYYIISLNDTESPILDVGSSADSVILQWLSLLKYKNLYACDIRKKGNKYPERNIKFSVQDLTSTNYPDNYFKAITSISVIEHGVNLSLYIKEMHRILQKGGLLLTSADYWSEKVDCNGIYPYGKEMGEMKVFTPDEIMKFCNEAMDYGFELCSNLDLSTKEKVVRWDRVHRDYTFIFIALKKK